MLLFSLCESEPEMIKSKARRSTGTTNHLPSLTCHSRLVENKINTLDT